ncbi:MAG: prepilin-type N-terminal cleavage/methylation domain-containing protein [Candidatus Paceibacterota bacterium]
MDRKKGFSLIELLVSVAIITLITGVVLANHARFGGSVLLGDLAYEIALSMRQAQIFGISVREFGVGSGQFDVGYGIHFNGFFEGSSYVFFSDTDDDQVYDYTTDPLTSDELVEVFRIGRNNMISDFCGVRPDLTTDCYADGDIDLLNISFKRPNPEATIKSDIPSVVYNSAIITVRSPQEITRTITVESTGQISVEQTN